MAEQEKAQDGAKDTAKEGPQAAAKAAGRRAAREDAAMAGEAAGEAEGGAGAAEAPARAADAGADLFRLQAALQRAQFERLQKGQALCSEANARLAALRAEVSERLAERGAALQREMAELWQDIQSRQAAHWQGADADAATRHAEAADLARAQIRLQGLQATLGNLAVLDPEASDIWLDGLTREADIRSTYERDLEALSGSHAEAVDGLFSQMTRDDLPAGLRRQVDTMRAWYGRC